MFISVTLPAKYRCLNCGDLFIDPQVEYERKGRYYHIHDTCPACRSRKIESREQFYSVECTEGEGVTTYGLIKITT